MKNFHMTVAAMLAAAALIAGCADEPYYQSQPQPSYGAPPSPGYVNTGYVDRIEVIRKGDSSNIAGTIIGGIIGGLIGHQIGGGSGQTAATIVGAAGGAYAGNRIENRTRGANETFRVTVRLDNGAFQTVTQDSIMDLRTGDRVRVENNQVFRI